MKKNFVAWLFIALVCGFLGAFLVSFLTACSKEVPENSCKNVYWELQHLDNGKWVEYSFQNMGQECDPSKIKNYDTTYHFFCTDTTYRGKWVIR